MIAEDEIKINVIIANKYKFKAKSFIIPIFTFLSSFYGNYHVITSSLFPSFFWFLSASSETFSRHLKKKYKYK